MFLKLQFIIVKQRYLSCGTGLYTQVIRKPSELREKLDHMTAKIARKRNPLFYIFFTLVLLASGLLACTFFGGLGQSAIPASAQVGIEPGSARILGYFQLNDWVEGASSPANLTIFEARLIETDENEIRVFLNDGQSARYVGALSDQLQLPGIKTLFIDFGGQRCIIGWASPEIQGSLHLASDCHGSISGGPLYRGSV